MSETTARRRAELAARTSYGRLVALLAARSRDIAAAEDALSEALVSALETWPHRGVPDNPDAWLLTVARNRILNAHRRRSVEDRAFNEIERRLSLGEDRAEFPDERLKLLFVCAHPTIEPAARTPMMLQTVLGLDAGRIASAFLVSPATMGQRLVRAKARIREGGLRFELPSTSDMPERLGDVLAAVYAAYGVGWDAVDGASSGAQDLAGEAIYLGRLVADLLPDEPEAQGLLALMLYCEARRPARRSPTGRFVQLDAQDWRLWNRDMIVEAENRLTAAARRQVLGRFQCEAAIQSVHVQRPFTGATNHAALITLYGLLCQHFPGAGALVGYAAALANGGRIDDARQALALIDPAKASAYQPYWVTRALVDEKDGNLTAAGEALETALGLTEDAAIRTFLLDKCAQLAGPQTA